MCVIHYNVLFYTCMHASVNTILRHAQRCSLWGYPSESGAKVGGIQTEANRTSLD